MYIEFSHWLALHTVRQASDGGGARGRAAGGKPVHAESAGGRGCCGRQQEHLQHAGPAVHEQRVTARSAEPAAVG